MAKGESALLLPELILHKEDAPDLHLRIPHSTHEYIWSSIKVLVIQQRFNALVVMAHYGRHGTNIEANNTALVDFAEPEHGFVQVLFVEEQQKEITPKDWDSGWTCR